MLRWRHYCALLLFGAGILIGADKAYANNCVSIVAGGNWSAVGTWTGCGGLVSQNGDSVTITAGGTVTLDANTNSVGSLTVAGTLTLGNSRRE